MEDTIRSSYKEVCGSPEAGARLFEEDLERMRREVVVKWRCTGFPSESLSKTLGGSRSAAVLNAGLHPRLRECLGKLWFVGPLRGLLPAGPHIYMCGSVAWPCGGLSGCGGKAALYEAVAGARGAQGVLPSKPFSIALCPAVTSLALLMSRAGSFSLRSRRPMSSATPSRETPCGRAWTAPVAGLLRSGPGSCLMVHNPGDRPQGPRISLGTFKSKTVARPLSPQD